MRRPSLRSAGASLALCLALGACAEEAAPPAPPPAFVEVMTVTTSPVPNAIELPGRIEAVRTAQVRPRIDGIIERRLFEEGVLVREGAPLFAIDPRDARAQVASAQAVLNRALAARTNASAVVRRYQPLVRERAVSAQEFDTALSDQRQAEAQVGEAQAALARAQLQLSYTTVRAPISGRVGRAEVTEGALVSATQTTPLTRVDQVTPVYAVFTVSSAQVLTTIQNGSRGEIDLPQVTTIPVQLELENGSTYGPIGRIDFAGATVSPDTGTQVVRAQFPNPAGLLRPGEFVRGRLEVGVIPDGIVIPSRAVQIQGEQASVSILQRDGTVAARPVKLGELLGQRWVILSGLRRGDRVITNGWQRVQPGQKAQVRRPGATGGRPARLAPTGGQADQPPAGAPTRGS